MNKKIKSIVYGEGGHDESKPENNVIEIIYYTKDELAELAKAEAKASQRQAILDRLGLTSEEAALLLS
jgi:hypothetical protein